MDDPILLNPNSAITEALACREALQWLRMHEFDMVEIESDSQILILGIRWWAPSEGSLLGILIGDFSTLAKLFKNLKFSFVRWSANRVAYSSVKATGFNIDYNEWFTTPPQVFFLKLCMQICLNF